MEEQRNVFDFVIAGGGVVGCALLERVQRSYPGSRCCLVEQGDILSGASAGNSGILHTGFDAPLGSIESTCMLRGYKLIHELYASFSSDKPFQMSKNGALMVSWSESDDIYMKGVAQNIPSCIPFEIWDSKKVYEHEPNLRRKPRARGGLWIPEESVIDPFSFPITLLRLAKQLGSEIYTNTELISASFVTKKSSSHWVIQIEKKSSQISLIKASVLINCAGNYGDIVESRILGDSDTPFHITPRKGQFLVYEAGASNSLVSTILPIPTLRTKGVLVCRSIYGNIIVGPTAEDQKDRKTATIDNHTREFLKEKGESILPCLKNFKIIGMYAGLRPASEHRDYQIRIDAGRNYVCVGGIRSTGLTGCMGIAEYVAEQMKSSEILKTLKYQPYSISTPTLPDSSYQMNTKTSTLEYQSELTTKAIRATHNLPILALAVRSSL